jgi:hypothetical protein
MENNSYWVLAYGDSLIEKNVGHIKKFDNFDDADKFAVMMNENSQLLYSITCNIDTVKTYCEAYNLNH